MKDEAGSQFRALLPSLIQRMTTTKHTLLFSTVSLSTYSLHSAWYSQLPHEKRTIRCYFAYTTARISVDRCTRFNNTDNDCKSIGQYFNSYSGYGYTKELRVSPGDQQTFEIWQRAKNLITPTIMRGPERVHCFLLSVQQLWQHQTKGQVLDLQEFCEEKQLIFLCGNGS